jgi:hypothetical protein
VLSRPSNLTKDEVGVMKKPVNTVTVAIDGIGEFTNEFRQ